MKLAIVGSRQFSNYESMIKVYKRFVDAYGTPDFIISGGAHGADAFAEILADRFNIKTIIMHPNWVKYGKPAGMIRNSEIVKQCTHMLAFPIGSTDTSPGTWDSIKKAQKEGKEVWIN